jgi:hypothetical protein
MSFIKRILVWSNGNLDLEKSKRQINRDVALAVQKVVQSR